MSRIKRRDFLKGMAISSAVVTEELVRGNVKKAQAACATTKKYSRPYSKEQADIPDKASFDFYVDHKVLQVAATSSESERTAEFDIQLNPISASGDVIELNAVPIDAPSGFKYRLDKSQVKLGSSNKSLQCKVIAPAGSKEGSRALFKVEGRRGEEIEEIRLMVKVITAFPEWRLAKSDLKVKEQPLKVTAGESIRFRLELANKGHVEDNFAISVSTPNGWKAALTDENGSQIKEISVEPVQGLFQWDYPEKVFLEVMPEPTAKLKKVVPFTVKATSKQTGEVDTLTVNAYYSEALFSINDMDGLDPRRHYLQAGASTSYKLHLKNRASSTRTFFLDIKNLPDGWHVDLPQKSLRVDPNNEDSVLLIVKAPSSASINDQAEFQVAAVDDQGLHSGNVRLKAEVNDIPKIYMLIIDSLDYKYLELNKNGDGPGKEGDWLCPNLRQFMKKGVSFSNARCGMPAATDMNHTTIVTGATTGTLGAYWVSGYYAGLDEVGDMKVVRPNPEVLRYGKTGKKLPRIFDMLKDRYPDSRSFVISNKAWVSYLHEDGEAVKMGITGSNFPVYAFEPPKFVLGDPPSDINPSDRRPVKPMELTTNLSPLDMLPQILAGDLHLMKPLFEDVSEFIGRKPGWFPDDKWIADTARQVIQEEDPDVLYVNLAAVDDAGHLFGAAWDPDEWKKAKGLFYGSTWVSKYSEQARREEILDVIREADIRFAEIVKEIESRDMMDKSIIVFAADHSMVTEGYKNQGYAPIDINEYLRAYGIVAPKHYGMAWGLNHWSAIFDVRDEQTLNVIKRHLQGMAVDDPIKGKDFHPCIVLDSEGIKTGRDDDNPYLPENERKITEPMELYSEYYSGKKGLITWPELCIFYREHYQAATPGDSIRRGVNGIGERIPMLPKHGNRLVGIHGSKLTTHVPMVFSGPKIQSNRNVNIPATLHDIIPTICYLLGWETPETVAGKNRKEIFIS